MSVPKSNSSKQEQVSTFSLIYDVVRCIPQGKVASYGQVALLAGNPRWARVVGYALHVNPEPGTIPCHRVVMRDGSLTPGFTFGGLDAQRAMLECEGVLFTSDGKVDLQQCRWQPDLASFEK